MVINEEQARTVRMIFDWYLDGLGLRAIQFKLEQEGRLTSTGLTRWHVASISKILKNSFYCGLIIYHKQWTPDYLEQKKINNIGDMEFTVVEGEHKHIISVEEYEKAQAIMKKSQRNNPNCGAGERRTFGQRKPIDVWTKLLECGECGHKFNRHLWHKNAVKISYGYQCYGQVRSSTVRTREKKGLPTDDTCVVPVVTSWKLQMMAKYIINNYLGDKKAVIDMAESILEKHIYDPKPKNDNSELIEQKKEEEEKLRARLKNLRNMRADNEIDKEEFLEMKTETESRLAVVLKELDELSPTYVEDTDADSRKNKIVILKYALEKMVKPDEEKDIPEEVIEAFVEKIIAKRGGYEWYLRYSADDDDTPKQLIINGKRKNTAKAAPFCSIQDRLLSLKASKTIRDKHIMAYALDATDLSQLRLWELLSFAM